MSMQDNVFVVKSLLKKRGKDKYLVEWYGFPQSEATWESSKNIPGFIIKVCICILPAHHLLQYFNFESRHFAGFF